MRTAGRSALDSNHLFTKYQPVVRIRRNLEEMRGTRGQDRGTKSQRTVTSKKRFGFYYKSRSLWSLDVLVSTSSLQLLHHSLVGLSLAQFYRHH